MKLIVVNLQTILKRFDFTVVRRRVERGRYYWDLNKVLNIGAVFASQKQNVISVLLKSIRTIAQEDSAFADEEDEIAGLNKIRPKVQRPSFHSLNPLFRHYKKCVSLKLIIQSSMQVSVAQPQ
jgi:hypothetical protein